MAGGGDRAAVLDRRFGQEWSRGQALKNALLRAAIGAALRLLDRLPPPLLLALGRGAGRVARGFDRAARARALARAGRCLPEPAARAAAVDCFVRAGEHLALSLLLRRPRVRASSRVTIPAPSLAVFRDALAAGRGALVVSAHLGPFEMIPAVIAELGFHPAVVVRESYDPALDVLVDAHRRARGVEVIHRGKAFAALRILRALAGGRPVGVLPDLGGRGLPSLPTSFLGVDVLFPIGAAELAQRAGCALLLGTLARAPASSGASHELVFETIDATGTVEELTRRVADRLAHAVLRSPNDWLWMAPPHLPIAEDSRGSLFCPTIHESEPGRD